MPYKQLLSSREKTIGTKQTLKAIERGQAKVVFVALDAEQHVVSPVKQACALKGLQIIEVESMQLLGKACGIEVGCASAAVLED